MTTTTHSPSQHGREFMGHPAGLYICFGTELWERFSFYGMKYLLLLYLTKYHLFDDAAGLAILGSYTALVYAMPLVGGLIADRYLGMRRAVVYGGLLLVAGHLGMAFEGEQARMLEGSVVRDDGALQVFYLSLALIIMGVGFLKPNISTVVGKLYKEDDPRRDAGFTIFYMGINIGAFAATLLCGWLGEVYGWAYGFGAAGIGMALGLVLFIWGQPLLEGHGVAPSTFALSEKRGPIRLDHLIYLSGLAGVVVIWQTVQATAVVGTLLNVVSLATLAGLGWYIFARCDRVQRDRMLALVVLIVSTVFFWALFEQGAGSMTLFADRDTDKSLLGVSLTASQFGAANSFFIFTLAPAFALLWTWLGRRNMEPSTPVKFGLGILQAGLGFGALAYGAQFPNEAGLISAWWLILAYLLHTTGELCLSPVGLSAVTKLSVPGVVGVMMGAWFLASAYSGYVAALLGTMVSESEGFITLFDQLLWAGVIAGVVLLMATPFLKRLMHGIR